MDLARDRSCSTKMDLTTSSNFSDFAMDRSTLATANKTPRQESYKLQHITSRDALFQGRVRYTVSSHRQALQDEGNHVLTVDRW